MAKRAQESLYHVYCDIQKPSPAHSRHSTTFAKHGMFQLSICLACDILHLCRANSASQISPGYRILFENFDYFVAHKGKVPNPSSALRIREIYLKGIPVDDVPCVEVWDGVNGCVYCTYDQSSSELVPDLCKWSEEEATGSFLTQCDVYGDFGIVVRFGGEHAAVKDKATLILKYQHHAGVSLYCHHSFTCHLLIGFLSPKTSLVLCCKDVDANPEYSDSLENEDFSMVIHLEAVPSSAVVPMSPKLNQATDIESLYLPPNKRGVFDRGLEEVIYSCILSSSVANQFCIDCAGTRSVS